MQRYKSLIQYIIKAENIGPTQSSAEESTLNIFEQSAYSNLLSPADRSATLTQLPMTYTARHFDNISKCPY